MEKILTMKEVCMDVWDEKKTYWLVWLIFTNKVKICVKSPLMRSILMTSKTKQWWWCCSPDWSWSGWSGWSGWRIPGDWVTESWLREAGAGVRSRHSGASCWLLRAPSAHFPASDSNQLLGVNVDKKFLLKVTMNWGSGVGEDGHNYPQHNIKLKLNDINQQSLCPFSLWKNIKLETLFFRHWFLWILEMSENV